MAAALLALATELLPAWWLDWQPGRLGTEPWRMLTAAFVHWSTPHLLVNLAGCVVVAAFGLVARLPPLAGLAWLAAWPLTHAALLLRPELAHYGGLSGVLHAAVAVAAVWLLSDGARPRRWVGAAVLAGLVGKVLLEHPLGPVLRPDSTLGIATAPLAHATGAAAGVLCALVLLSWRTSRSRRRRRQSQA